METNNTQEQDYLEQKRLEQERVEEYLEQERNQDVDSEKEKWYVCFNTIDKENYVESNDCNESIEVDDYNDAKNFIEWFIECEKNTYYHDNNYRWYYNDKGTSFDFPYQTHLNFRIETFKGSDYELIEYINEDEL